MTPPTLDRGVAFLATEHPPGGDREPHLFLIESEHMLGCEVKDHEAPGIALGLVARGHRFQDAAMALDDAFAAGLGQQAHRASRQ